MGRNSAPALFDGNVKQSQCSQKISEFTPGWRRAMFVRGLSSGPSQSHFHLLHVNGDLLTILWIYIWKKEFHVWHCNSNVMCLPASPALFISILFPFISVTYDVSYSSNACSFFLLRFWLRAISSSPQFLCVHPLHLFYKTASANLDDWEGVNFLSPSTAPIWICKNSSDWTNAEDIIDNFQIVRRFFMHKYSELQSFIWTKSRCSENFRRPHKYEDTFLTITRRSGQLLAVAITFLTRR